MITVADLLPWRRPPSARPQPEPERGAGRLAGTWEPAGLDPVVFGTWPGTYQRWAGDGC